MSKIFDFALDKAVSNKKISKTMKQSIKSEKNSIVKDIKTKINENFDEQIKNVEKINEYNGKWEESFNNKDLSGMKKAYNNIKKYLQKTLPLEKILKSSRKIEIMQNLVENTGKFEITEEEKELAEALAN